MKKLLITTVGAFTLTFLISSTANAALVTRLSGQALYDTILDVTWLRGGSNSIAAGTRFDDGASNTDGRMTWDSANNWAASLNVGGVTDWRLPTVGPINGTDFNTTLANDGTRSWTQY